MTEGRKPGKLTSEEVDAFLATPVIARLATVQPDGAPYVAPVWQHWDGTVPLGDSEGKIPVCSAPTQ